MQDSMIKVPSILNIPEPKLESSTNLQSVVSTASHLSPSIHSVNQRQSTTSDQQIILPPIFERQSLVADVSTVVVATDLYSNGCSNLDTRTTRDTQMTAQSATTLEKSSLPKLLPQTRCIFTIAIYHGCPSSCYNSNLEKEGLVIVQ